MLQQVYQETFQELVGSFYRQRFQKLRRRRCMLLLASQTILCCHCACDCNLWNLPAISDRILLLKFVRLGAQKSGLQQILRSMDRHK